MTTMLMRCELYRLSGIQKANAVFFCVTRCTTIFSAFIYDLELLYGKYKHVVRVSWLQEFEYEILKSCHSDEKISVNDNTQKLTRDLHLFAHLYSLTYFYYFTKLPIIAHVNVKRLRLVTPPFPLSALVTSVILVKPVFLSLRSVPSSCLAE